MKELLIKVWIKNKTKIRKVFFDLNIFGLEITPTWGVLIGLVLTVLFLGSMIGSIGFVILIISLVKVGSNYFRK